MEVYKKRTITKEELEEDKFSNDYGTNETKINLLNTLKEVLELTNFTSKAIVEEVLTIYNELTENEIINISLYIFLELLVDPDCVLASLGLAEEVFNEELKVANIGTVTSNLIYSSKDSLLDFSEESIISSVKEVLKAEEVEEKKIRKLYLESKKLEIEKALAELESD